MKNATHRWETTFRRVFSFRRSQSSMAGVTMIELMVVIGLIAFIYSIAVPQFNMRTGTEAATKVQRLADDIRSAFDMSVLNNKPYRISFNLATGKYSLEEPDREVWIGDSKTPHDPTEDEEKNIQVDFDAKTKEMESLASEKVKDADGKDIDGSNLSPILRHRSAAAPVKWTKVENLEWNDRSLGDFLLISEMQAEHHPEKQLMTDLGPQGRAFIYFLPQGYVEKAYIRVAFKADDMVVDEEKKPYTIVTKPFTGSADVNTGIVEVDVHDLSEDMDVK